MSATYDETKIGEKIARGGDRRIYRYGDGEVIKISTLHFFVGGKLHDKLLHDYLVCKRYMPRFVTEVRDATPPGSKGHVEIQKFVQGEMLRKKHLNNPKTRAQFKELLADMDAMVAEGYPEVDLSGSGGIFKAQLSNVLVDEEGNLRIIDAALFEGKSVGVLGLLLEAIMPFAKMRQHYLLRKFLK